MLLFAGFFRKSIPRRIQASLIGIYATTYLVTSIVVYTGARSAIMAASVAALDQLADLKYAQLGNGIGGLETNLRAWSQLEVMNDLVSHDIDKRVAQTLEGLKRLYGLDGDIYAFDANSRMIASSRVGVALGSRIPPEWENPGDHLRMIPRQADPMTGQASLVLDVAIFGSFERTYRTGTLVVTQPWRILEDQLAASDGGATLIQQGARPTILSGDHGGPIVSDAGPAGATRGYIVGRSHPRGGLLGNWQVLTWQETATLFRPLRQVALNLILLGIVLFVPIALLGRWLSLKLTAPVAALTRAVREIADTDRLDARVPISSADELGILARSFNRMTDNLERASRERETFLRELAALNHNLEAKIGERTHQLELSIEAQQRLIRDISHEIKSPLARLTVALELARRLVPNPPRQQFDRIEKEVETISALASELLTLARLEDASGTTHHTAIDLGHLVDDIVADALYEAPERSSDVTLRRVEPSCLTFGDEILTRRAIENVVRNALFYTDAGIQVAVTVSNRAPDIVAVEVRDRGPGVPPSALPNLFEPFYRVDEARTRATGGTGIGLAICKRIVDLQGGSVEARNDTPSGLIVLMRFKALRGPAKALE